MSSNTTNTTIRNIGASIFMRTTEAPFVIFVLLAITLIIGTLIAVIIMIHQHNEHIRKLNAVRGFHQQDVQQAAHLTGQDGANQTAERRASLSLSDLQQQQQLQEQQQPGSPALVKGKDGKPLKHNHQPPTRLIFDFHHTPKQPALPDATTASSVRRGRMPALDLNASPASSGSFGGSPSSNRRDVGMSFGRNPNE